jgi:hypothetical protein
MDVQAELDRCRREIAEIEARPDVRAGTAPAWLVTLGLEDWRMEMRLIEREAAAQTCAAREVL